MGHTRTAKRVNCILNNSRKVFCGRFNPYNGWMNRVIERSSSGEVCESWMKLVCWLVEKIASD
jgi:hypothetical protein